MNEKLVMETPQFKKLIEENNIQLLLGDWTNRDEAIGNFLKNKNLIGIPAYFIVKPSGEYIFLGETLSLDKIKKSL